MGRKPKKMPKIKLKKRHLSNRKKRKEKLKKLPRNLRKMLKRLFRNKKKKPRDRLLKMNKLIRCSTKKDWLPSQELANFNNQAKMLKRHQENLQILDRKLNLPRKLRIPTRKLKKVNLVKLNSLQNKKRN
jgi:hypothetical protein